MSFVTIGLGCPQSDLHDTWPFADDAPTQDDRHHRREPLHVWRTALQAGVTAVSPALVDMAKVRDVDLGRAVCRLRPPAAWRGGLPQLVVDGWDGVWPKAPGPQRRATPWGRLGRTPQAVRTGAVPKDDPAGAFFVALDGSALSGCARVGGADLLTHGGLLQIWFGQRLPDTVLLGVEGKRVDRLIDHPVLTGRAYPIVRAFHQRSWTVVEVETGLVPFAMPWPHLGAEAVAENAA